MRLAARAIFTCAAVLLTRAAAASPVLLISVDGLRPADVIEADRLGLKIPVLKGMMARGAYAEGIVGVLPTLTYPSHTTLITGAAPARHGIGNNLTFDPTNINQGGWDWYAEDIRTPTLWSATRAAGLPSVNVHWPVSVGAPVDMNLPQIWRTGHDDDRKLMRALATPGLLERLEARLGRYAAGIDESVEADENRAGFAAALITDFRPALTTVYLASVDHVEHAKGPGSREALATIERNDKIIGRLVAAARAAEPDLTVVVVSDHGFQPVANDVNLFKPFIDDGLITLDKDRKVVGWQAMPWIMGGSAAIVLARPENKQLQARVATLLAKLKNAPELGIDEIIDRDRIGLMGGSSLANYLVAFRPGFEPGRDPAAPMIKASSYKGMHGYLPTDTAMRSTLIVDGPALKRHGNMGILDMRAIAPSIARMIGVSLGSAELPAAF